MKNAFHKVVISHSLLFVYILVICLHGSAQQSTYTYDPPGNLTAVTGTNAFAPSIATQPQSALFYSNNPVSLSVVASGAGVSYQWLSNGIPILGATSDTLLLTNLSGTNGNFSVIIGNASGSVTSTPAAIWADSNRNAIPDWWEMRYFGNLNQTADGDYDGDGVDNLDEYLEGTDPTNPNSYDPRLHIQASLGMVVASPNQPHYTKGQHVTLTAIPNSGQMFLGWSGSATGTNSTISLVMNSNSTAIANFGLPLAVALDNTNLTWTTGGDAPWFGQTQASKDGLGAAQSGTIVGGQQSWLQGITTHLTQPSQLSFWWNVSSQSPDALSFSVDGIANGSISGEAVGWQYFLADLPAGTHTLVWSYAKQSNDNPTGIPFADSGWVDEVTLSTLPVVTNCLSAPLGMVNWWPGDGNAVDIVSANNGTLLGGVNFTNGLVGRAFSFDGSSGYVSVPHNSFWDFGTRDFTIEFWANFKGTGGAQSLISCDDGGGSANKWIFFYGYEVQGLTFHLNGTPGSWTIGNFPFSPNAGQWYHIALARKGSAWTFYVNGFVIGTDTESVIVPSMTAPLTIGNAEGGFNFNGLMDDISIYNRALSFNEITASYLAGSYGKCEPQPVISSISATSGAVGNVITIQGANLAAVAAVLFNGTPAQFTAQSNGKLNVYVPVNATTGPLTLQTISGGIVVATGSFIVAGPECSPPPAGLIDWWAGERSAVTSVGGNNGTLHGGVTYTQGVVGQCFNFNGATGFISTSQLITNPQAFSLCLSFRTATTQGGVLLGFGQSQSNTTANYDRNIYLDNTGVIHFGVFESTEEVINSAAGYNDNLWHQVVASLSPSTGISLYVDGVLVGNNLAANSAAIYNGYWIIGENNLGSWPFQPSSYYFNGKIDEISIFNRALSATEVQSIYNAASAGMCNGLIFDTSPTGLRWTQNGLQLRVSGRTELGPVVIYASSNLVSWTAIYTNPPAASPIQFIDTIAKNLRTRFYRAASQ